MRVRVGHGCVKGTEAGMASRASGIVAAHSPSSSLSSSFEPVLRLMTSARTRAYSVAVVNPMGIILEAVSNSLSAFTSLIPLTFSSAFLVEYATCVA